MLIRHENYDAIVIGPGQGGAPLAIDLARAGLHTALLENCGFANRRPSNGGAAKTVQTNGFHADLSKAQLRKQAVMEGLRSALTRELRSEPDLCVLTGEARFENASSLLMREQDGTMRALHAPKILINTGIRPILPDVPGLADVPHLTPGSARELDELPDHVLVLGGSYLGIELGQMFRRFGSAVSVIERRGQLLVREDRDVAATMAEVLRADGIKVFLETEAVGVTSATAGAVRLKVRTASAEHVLGGSHLLVVAGREPNTGGLDLPVAGIAVDACGYIKVNERLETSAPGVYALGGVNGGPAFADVVRDDMRIIRAVVLDRANATANPNPNPANVNTAIANIMGRMYSAFIDPQLSRIGLTEAGAREQGRAVRVARPPTLRAARIAKRAALMKVVIDSNTDQILGAAVIGADSGEIMTTLQTAIIGDITYTALCDGMGAQPTPGSPLALGALLHA